MAASPQVAALAEAYRRAMAVGDQRLTGSTVERKILHALVAESALDTTRWIKTRMPNGNEEAEPLDALVPALQEGNWVGRGLDYAQGRLLKEARGLSLAAIGVMAWPAWVAAVVLLVAGAFGFAQDAGVSVGTAIAPLVLGGGFLVYALFRGLVSALPEIGGAAGSIWDEASSLGAEAEAIFSENVAAPIAAIRGTTQGPALTVAKKVRGAAQTVVGIAYVLVVVMALYFFAGVWHAFESASKPADFCDSVPESSLCTGNFGSP